MSGDKAALASLAGLVASGIAFAAVIWFLTSFSMTFALFRTPEPLGPTEQFIAYAVAPALLALAGVLPARILGASWSRSFSIPAVVSVIVSAPLILAGFDPETMLVGMTAAPALVTLASSVDTRGNPAVILATGYSLSWCPGCTPTRRLGGPLRLGRPTRGREASPNPPLRTARVSGILLTA